MRIILSTAISGRQTNQKPTIDFAGLSTKVRQNASPAGEASAALPGLSQQVTRTI